MATFSFSRILFSLHKIDEKNTRKKEENVWKYGERMYPVGLYKRIQLVLSVTSWFIIQVLKLISTARCKHLGKRIRLSIKIIMFPV